MTILKILATMVGGVIMLGFFATLLFLLVAFLWWLIIPVLLFIGGALLYNWGRDL